MAIVRDRTRTVHKLVIRTLEELPDGFVGLTATALIESDRDQGPDFAERQEDGFKDNAAYMAENKAGTMLRLVTNMDNSYALGAEILVDVRLAR